MRDENRGTCHDCHGCVSQLAYLLVAPGVSAEDALKDLVDVDEILSQLLEFGGQPSPIFFNSGCKSNTCKSRTATLQ